MRCAIDGSASSRRQGGRRCIALILHPLCLILFRLMIFDTLPRDDYAPMLLWWLGQPGAVPPTSPYGYRVLSMLAAVPFYHLLPPFALTNLPGNLTPRICAAPPRRSRRSRSWR